jgi:hypothetical protein
MPSIGGNGMGLVDAAGPQPADIELLQRHDVGLASRDHLRDAPRRQQPVDPQTAMHIVGHDAEAVGIAFWHDELAGASIGKDPTTGHGSTALYRPWRNWWQIRPA